MHRRARQESLALQKGVHPSTVDAIASVLRLLKRKAVEPLYDCLADGSFNWEPEAVVDEGRSVAQKPRGGAAAARQQHSEHGPSMGHAIAPFGHQAGAVAARPMTVPVAAPSISACSPCLHPGIGWGGPWLGHCSRASGGDGEGGGAADIRIPRERALVGTGAGIVNSLQTRVARTADGPDS